MAKHRARVIGGSAAVLDDEGTGAGAGTANAKAEAARRRQTPWMHGVTPSATPSGDDAGGDDAGGDDAGSDGNSSNAHARASAAGAAQASGGAAAHDTNAGAGSSTSTQPATPPATLPTTPPTTPPAHHARGDGPATSVDEAPRPRSAEDLYTTAIKFLCDGPPSSSSAPRRKYEQGLVAWMPDNACKKCPVCDATFYFFNRRHHCRLCGTLTCNKCTQKTKVRRLMDFAKHAQDFS